MTDTIFLNCPHCQKKEVAFDCTATLLVRIRNNARLMVTAICRNQYCRGPIALRMTPEMQEGKEHYLFAVGGMWWIEQMWPSPIEPYASDLLPENVRNILLEAEQTLAAGAPSRVVRGEFRVVIDVATKEILQGNEELLNGAKPKRSDLYNRIEFLAQYHLLTPALAEWAQSIRGITNGDHHTGDTVTPDEANEIAEYTRLFLAYAFEIPAAVTAAKDAAESKKAEGNG